MSRSRKKQPFVGVCAYSDKWSKRKANRKMRRLIKLYNKVSKVDEIDPIQFNKNQFSNVWCFAKDGKIRITDKRYLRK